LIDGLNLRTLGFNELRRLEMRLALLGFGCLLLLPGCLESNPQPMPQEDTSHRGGGRADEKSISPSADGWYPPLEGDAVGSDEVRPPDASVAELAADVAVGEFAADVAEPPAEVLGDVVPADDQVGSDLPWLPDGWVPDVLFPQDGESVDGESPQDTIELQPLTLVVFDQGGFDDFSSPGAALGFAVDVDQGFVLVAALKFDLPLFEKEFAATGDVAATLAGYSGGKVPPALADAVAKYPLLASAVTDTAGVRTMASDVALILLEGDLAANAPLHAYVASAGTVKLKRLDGPKDTLEGSATFLEATATAKDGKPKPGGKAIELAPFYFEWDTTKQ